MKLVDRWLRGLVRGKQEPEETTDLDRCRAVREALLQSDELVGDVFETTGSDRRLPIAEEARRASVPPDKARILYRMVRTLRPSRIVEFGSALGVSGCHLAAALLRNGVGELVTVEASPSRSEMARRSIERAAPGVTKAVCGFFDDHLDALDGADLFFLDGNHYLKPTLGYVDAAVSRMTTPGVLVLDDIEWSAEMTQAWRELRRDDRFSGAGGVCGMGVLAIGDNPDISPLRWWQR
jgi:predicted O-methyltransferase YrrM